MTHLEQWLSRERYTMNRFAQELGISRDPVRLLAVPGTTAAARRYRSIRFEVLAAVATATGIAPGVLIEDAMGWTGTQEEQAAA